MKKLIVAIDFDGTCTRHKYPHIGADIGAWPVIKEMSMQGVLIILFTMRSGKELDDAIAEFSNRNIPLFGVNRNPDQHQWTASAKPYAHLYIDDAALGVPLIHAGGDERPYVDWQRTRELLVKSGYITICDEHNSQDDAVTIPKNKLIALNEDSRMMQALRNAGVDNWEGWDVAVKSLEK
jgi:hypothetical protein